MKKLNKKGFTLVEMLVVIAIIAVLVAIIIPTTSSATTKAKAATDAANLRSITAEATIDFLEDQTLTNTYTFTPKLVDAGGTLAFYNTKNGLLAVYTVSSKNYTVASFSKAAESGTASDAEDTTTYPVTGQITLTVGTKSTDTPTA